MYLDLFTTDSCVAKTIANEHRCLVLTVLETCEISKVKLKR